MRTIPPGIEAALGGGVTTFARCWRVRRRDGIVLGFTDHDRTLTFDGTDFAAATGLEAADSDSELGFAVGGGDVAGVLTAASLSEDDLAAGLFDAATLETWLVDWQAPENRVLLQTGLLGEVRRTGQAFSAELRGEAQRFEEVRGRVFQAACSADFGDARCGIPTNGPRWSAVATVTATDGQTTIQTADLVGYVPGWFTAGHLSFATGANAGLTVEIRSHVRVDARAVLDLWQPMPRPVGVGDRVRVTAGCDKRFDTCARRFANTLNFRGFPHMPGNDLVLRVAQEGDPGMDGGSLFR
jgi:uncharacterized phage protein (TIGR02218 family)